MIGFRRRTCSPFLLLLSGLLIPDLALTAAAQQRNTVPGLQSNALVVRDADGMPHICSGSDRDTMLVQGYVQARDRFFQMDTLRRTFSGTLSELVGPGALESDVQFRTFGLRRAAQESLAAYEAAGLTASLELLEAYAIGVNHFLRSDPLPPEYGALEVTRVPEWTVIDSLVMIKGLAFGLSFDLLELELTPMATAYAAAGAVGGFDGLALLFEDIVRSAPFDPTVSLPAGAATAAAPKAAAFQAPDRRTAALARSYRDRAVEVPMLKSAFEPRGDHAGSNWWVLSGARTESGHPMLANDPHLALDTPSTFHEVHLLASARRGCGLDATEDGLRESLFSAAPEVADSLPRMAELNATGVSFAGVPGLVQGCNAKMCWGSTVNPMDVTDVYREVLTIDPATGLPQATTFEGQPEPLVLIPQTFLVNQLGDGLPDNLADAGLGPLEGGLTLVVPRRNNGPIIAVDSSRSPVVGLSVQYTGWRGTLEFEAFRRWLRTDDVDEFVAGLQYFDVGSQNWSYADVDGTIAYFTSAELPIREDLQILGIPAGGFPPFMVRDGTHVLPHEWLAVQNPQPQQALAYEILPFDEMPQVRNPAAGYVINANNDPIGNTLDNNVFNEQRPGGGAFYLSPGYTSLRVGRIGRLMEELLADGNKATVGDLMVIQANNQLLDAELIAPFVIAAFANAAAPSSPDQLRQLAADPGVAEAVNRLAAWDYSTPTGIPQGYDPGDDPDDLPAPTQQEVDHSVAATLWSVFRGQVVRNVVDETLAGLGITEDHLPDSTSAYRALAHLLMSFDTDQGVGASGVSFFSVSPGLTPAQARDLRLLESLRSALDLLAGDEFAPAFGGSTDQDDYRWGYLHRIELEHLLGAPFSIPSAGGFFPVSVDLPGLARAGGYQAVDASSHSARADDFGDFTFDHGPARRFVAALEPSGIEAYQILPGGESGVLGNPHYADQLGRWLTNSYHPLILEPRDIDGEALATLEPLCLSNRRTLCLQDDHFKVTLSWTLPGRGPTPAGVVPGASNASGNFYFFDTENWEMLVKVLDGCAMNGHFWVFASAATDVGWELVIEDTSSGETWTASSPYGTLANPVADVDAFVTCP